MNPLNEFISFPKENNKHIKPQDQNLWIDRTIYYYRRAEIHTQNNNEELRETAIHMLNQALKRLTVESGNTAQQKINKGEQGNPRYFCNKK